jgi:hypothetical protein
LAFKEFGHVDESAAFALSARDAEANVGVDAGSGRREDGLECGVHGILQ